MNAKQEFLKEIEGKELLCATLALETNDKRFNLKVGFSTESLQSFLQLLDFDYDEHWGLDGHSYIWYKDGSWSERCQYNRSEIWDHRNTPKIPEYILR